jgi:short-subunit dehydrogenase
MEIAGKRALLTGATGGIGRAIATSLAARGASVAVSSRKGEELTELAAGLPGSGHTAIVSDLAVVGAAEELAREAAAEAPIDLLVANAGLPGTGHVDELSTEDVERALRVNLESPILLARALGPAMRERGDGHLVFIASLAGKAASPRTSIYNATKFGLRGFSLGLREDYVGTGVGVSVVLPGFIRDAGMFADSGAKLPPGVGTSTPGEVAAGVIKAVERDKAEVSVAPRQQRALVAFAHIFPSFAARAQRGTGTKIAEDLARGQTDKR